MLSEKNKEHVVFERKGLMYVLTLVKLLCKRCGINSVKIKRTILTSVGAESVKRSNISYSYSLLHKKV